ncbi:MAG: hypothetical protein ACYCO4_01860 [Sulfobacillus sp.]
MIAAVLKRSVGQELKEIKRLAQFAAFDAAEAKRLVRMHLGEFMEDDNKEWVAEAVRQAQAFALKRVQKAVSPQPADPLTRLPATADSEDFN